MSVHDDLAVQLRKLCPVGHETESEQASCDYCTERVATMIVMVNSHFFALTGKSFGEFELWTCEEAAEYMEMPSGGAGARARLSTLKIKAHGYRPHPGSGRPQALYLASQVRAATKENR